MKLPLLCMAMLAISSSFRVQREGVLSKPIISYKVVKFFPKSRLVHILCHSIQGSLPIIYTLMESSNITVSKKIMDNGPAKFPILATFKTRPDLLNYYCRASTASGERAYSDVLKLFWELWVPVSQPQANFSLVGTGSSQMVVVSCLASEGSPPITYMLLRKNGHILMEETPLPGRPANFSFPVNKISAWYACQAKNTGNTQRSALTLVPPGELPLAPTFVLAVSLTSMVAAFIILYQNMMKR
ncbi:protein IL-40 [Sarcophilus harrisii]|uniref:IL-40-like Ig domain-containing protein n=1 Tax=Sarcophilus harrisii TaxID=9305 RepID=G3X1G1_SARHA|nr:protein IL-40 [Sarcophilus harrisii]